MSFTQGAQRLAGQAGLLLGWRPDDFWRATPDELETALSVLGEGMCAADTPPDPALLAQLREMHPDG
jgi:hypothetical protein